MAVSRQQKAAVRAEPPPPSPAVRARAYAYLEATGMSLAALATEIGYARPSLDHFLRGRYKRIANTDVHLRAALWGYMHLHPVNGDTEQPLPRKLVPTAETKLLLERIDDARSHGQIVVVEGPPGTCKTTVSRWYEADRNRRRKHDTFRVRAIYGIVGTALLRKLCTKIGAYGHGTRDRLVDNLVRKLRQKGPSVILVDEAQYLLFNNGGALEQLRDVLDQANCGCVLFSHYRFVRELTNGLARDLEQWMSRVDFHERLKGLRATELDGVAREYLSVERLPPGFNKLLERVAWVQDRNFHLRSRHLPLGKRFHHHYLSIRRVHKFLQRIDYLRTIPNNKGIALEELAGEAKELLLSASGSPL